MVRRTDRTTTTDTGLVDRDSSRDVTLAPSGTSRGCLEDPLYGRPFQAKSGGDHDHSWAIDATAI